MYFGKIKEHTSSRVPPNQNVTTTFPVLHHGNVPYYSDMDQWSLQIFGEVHYPITLGYDEVLKLEQKEYQNDIHCVTGWSKLDTVWTGISCRSIAQRVKVKENARYVILHAEEDWSTNIPIEDFMKESSLLAHSYNHEKLTPEHGFPLRAVFPHLYFWKSAKWLRGIEFSAVDTPGFWERNGYHNYGDPFKEQRFTWD
ncbi:sulfite oxidase-like oxidoreductase [Cytobacillus gottheilii]|uniref:sulfite oxidase-like oxidoreductase n=1 Tax=Cytobacillus gottheilii TaxID=859144 RepID=UPI003CED4AA2